MSDKSHNFYYLTMASKETTPKRVQRFHSISDKLEAVKTERAFWKFNCCIKGVGDRQKAFAGMEHKRIWTYQYTRQEKAQTTWWWQRAQAQRFKDWSCSDTGNMQLPYNRPGGYLVHVLFSQCVSFPINRPWAVFRKTPVPTKIFHGYTMLMQYLLLAF